MNGNLKGRVASLQSFATLDGPGVRFAVFLQGCPLRCICCHNPETWDVYGGTEYTVSELLASIVKYKEYFGQTGGITLSGGEPLMQSDFCAELFRACRENGINTCLDTSGCLMNDGALRTLDYTDYCMLDIKYTSEEMYLKNVGCEMSRPLEFLTVLEDKKIPTRIRQVIIPGVNDSVENAEMLKKTVKDFSCVREIELLPFRKLCAEKYEKSGIAWPLSEAPEPSHELMKKLQSLTEIKR